MSFLFNKLQEAVHDIGNDFTNTFNGGQGSDAHGHIHSSGECADGTHAETQHRFQSFAPQREGNDAKWYVDGCAYMWAVSVALENAQESIWILDCTFDNIHAVS